MPGVAFLCLYPLSPDRIGGMDRFFWRLDEYAQKSGWKITWLFPAGGDHSHYLERGFHIVALPPETFLEAAAEYFARQPGFDLLVSVFVEYATRYAIQWKRCRIRRYLALDHMSRRIQKRTTPARWRETARSLITYPFIDGVVAICSYVRDEILRQFGTRWDSKIFMVSNGIDPEVFYPANGNRPEPGDVLHIAIVSHLIEEKGIQVFLHALSAARSRLGGVKVSIAGSGPYESGLRSLAGDLRLGEIVSFLGATSRQAELLRSADVTVAPSLWAEAFPFSVLESMACGVPAIASRIGGMPEMVGKEAAILVAPGDAEELASALTLLATDANLRRRMGAAGVRRTSEMYTLDQMLGGYVSVMNHLLAG